MYSSSSSLKGRLRGDLISCMDVLISSQADEYSVKTHASKSTIRPVVKVEINLNRYKLHIFDS